MFWDAPRGTNPQKGCSYIPKTSPPFQRPHFMTKNIFEVTLIEPLRVYVTFSPAARALLAE